MSLSYKNQSIDLDCKSMNSFLYDRDLRRDKVKLRQNIYIYTEAYLEPSRTSTMKIFCENS